MSQSSARAARRKPIPRRNLTPAEALQFQDIHRLINARKFELAQIKGNTALIPDGQKLAEQLEGVVNVLDDAGKQWIALKLEECGYKNGTKCSVNLNTGEVLLEEQP